MPTAGGQARSPLEQLLEVVTDTGLYKQRIADHARTKQEAEDAVMALGEKESALNQMQMALTDREKAVARREAIVDDREKQLAQEQEADRARRTRWKQLLPQIAELVK